MKTQQTYKRRRFRFRLRKSNLRILIRKPMTFMRVYRWPMLVLLIGATLDTITTMRSMYNFGAAGEIHPAMKILAEEFGVAVGVPLGTVVRLGFVLIASALWRPWCKWILLLCGVLYTLAAISNHFCLL